MGFLSKVMGFQTRARITIKFYSGRDETSVSVEGELTDQEWFWVFLLNLAKHLHTMGDPWAPILLGQLELFCGTVLQEPVHRYLLGKEVGSPLAGDVRAVAPRPSMQGITTEVIQKTGNAPTIQTSLPPGCTYEELGLSNLVFLDHVIRRVPPSSGYFTCLKLRLMLKYYEEVGSYRDPSSIVGAAVYAVQKFAELETAE